MILVGKFSAIVSPKIESVSEVQVGIFRHFETLSTSMVVVKPLKDFNGCFTRVDGLGLVNRIRG